MITHILLFFIFISNTTYIGQETTTPCEDSSGIEEQYCKYFLSTIHNDELELLRILADENGMIYFNIYLDTCTLQIPICVKDLGKEPDLLEFINTVTTQLKKQNIPVRRSFSEGGYDDEM